MAQEQSPDRDDRVSELIEHHRRFEWAWWLVILLGVWLLATPLTFHADKLSVDPAGGRSVWLPMDVRAQVMAWSDGICGVLLVVLGWLMLKPDRHWARWAACGLGIYLQAAPVLFWAPAAFLYINNTVVGMLVIALTVLIPGIPGNPLMRKDSPDVPPGWSYNPSSWPQRAPLIGLAFAGLLVSRYLAAYQLGYLKSVWDPFFGEGTRKVLLSDISESFPVSDGALGALSYTIEFLVGWMGCRARWRTSPSTVVVFGIVVVPLGLTHILLVIAQPVFVGYWCTWCLLAALLMLPMVPLALDEVVAMCQFLYKAVKQEGKPFWRTFWKGDTIEGGAIDDRSPDPATLPSQPGEVLRAGVWGVSLPWTLLVVSALGVWLLFAPAALGSEGIASDNDRIVGALLLTIAVLAMAEVARTARFLLALPALWMLAAPWILSGANTATTINSLVVGLAILALCLPRGPIHQSYGTWDRYIL